MGTTAHSERLETELQAAQDELQRCREEVAAMRTELLQLRESEQRMFHRAFHDDVTALPNRSYFRERLDLALQSRAAVAVFYIDIDEFKSLNDSRGHHVGDDVLKIVGKRMANALRTEDIVSRIGGDEFACLLVGVPTFDHLAQMARKILHSTSTPVHLDPDRFTVSVSIGIARFPADGLSTDALLRSADIAMYQAKRQKTGYAFFKAPTTVAAAAAPINVRDSMLIAVAHPPQ